MNEKKEIHDSEHNHPEGMEICPYLKWRNDETVRYGFPHISNFCYKPKKAQSIRLSYQKPFCLTEKYTECPVFQQEKINRLPTDICGKDNFKRGILRNIPLLMIVLFLVLGIITIIIIGVSRLPSIGVKNAITLSTSQPQTEEIVSSGSSWNDESSGKTSTPSLPTQNTSNNSAILSNNGIPVTRSAIAESDRISSLELNSVITFGPVGDSTFIPETIYSLNAEPSQMMYSDLSGKNLYSTIVAPIALRIERGYGSIYLVIP